MTTGVCKVRLHIPASQSLKEKRRIIKSIISRLRNQYNISIAEVDDYDLWQMATLGISCVSNSRQHVDEMINKILNFIVQFYPDVEVVDHEIEIMHGP